MWWCQSLAWGRVSSSSLRVDAGRGRARHVADVVRARAARDDADVRQPLEEVRAALGLDLADLQVAARGDVAVAAAVAVGEVGDGGELPVLEDAVVHAHAAHVAVLRRAHVEEAVVAPAEIVLGLRAGARQRDGLQPVVGLERVLGALPLLLVGQLLAGRDLPVLRLDLFGVGAGRLGGDAGGRPADGPHGAEAGGEAVQPVLLVGGEFHTHGQTLCGRGGQARDARRRPNGAGAQPPGGGSGGSVVSACTRAASCCGVVGAGPRPVAGSDAEVQQAPCHRPRARRPSGRPALSAGWLCALHKGRTGAAPMGARALPGRAGTRGVRMREMSDKTGAAFTPRGEGP